MKISENSFLYRQATEGFPHPPKDGCDFLLRLAFVGGVFLILIPAAVLVGIFGVGLMLGSFFYPELAYTDSITFDLILTSLGFGLAGIVPTVAIPYLIFSLMRRLCRRIELPTP
jgi:hypothetical protein